MRAICKLGWLAGVCVWFLSGCEKQYPDYVGKGIESPTPKESEHIKILPADGSSSQSTTDAVAPAASPETQPGGVVGATPDRTKWYDYAKAYHDVQTVPPPQFNGTPDPLLNNAYLNQVAQKMQALKDAKANAENDLSPQDREAWKQYQRNLHHESDD